MEEGPTYADRHIQRHISLIYALIQHRLDDQYIWWMIYC